jgi:hypothetical protein
MPLSSAPSMGAIYRVIYSIVESAKANNLNPFLYLTFLFEKLPQVTDLTNEQELDKLMPWSKTLPIACRIFKKQA